MQSTKYFSPKISASFLHQALEVEEPVDNVQLETDGGTLQPQPEPVEILEDHHPTDSQNQDSPPPSPSHQHISADELQDNLNSFTPQHDIPNRCLSFILLVFLNNARNNWLIILKLQKPLKCLSNLCDIAAIYQIFVFISAFLTRNLMHLQLRSVILTNLLLTVKRKTHLTPRGEDVLKCRVKIHSCWLLCIKFN